MTVPVAIPFGDDESASAHCLCGARLEFTVATGYGQLLERCPSCHERGQWRRVLPRPIAGTDVGDVSYTIEKIAGLAFRRIRSASIDTPAIAGQIYDLVPCLPGEAISARAVTDLVKQPIEVTCHILGRFADAGVMRREKRGIYWHYWRVK